MLMLDMANVIAAAYARWWGRIEIGNSSSGELY